MNKYYICDTNIKACTYCIFSQLNKCTYTSKMCLLHHTNNLTHMKELNYYYSTSAPAITHTYIHISVRYFWFSPLCQAFHLCLFAHIAPKTSWYICCEIASCICHTKEDVGDSNVWLVGLKNALTSDWLVWMMLWCLIGWFEWCSDIWLVSFDDVLISDWLIQTAENLGWCISWVIKHLIGLFEWYFD